MLVCVYVCESFSLDLNNSWQLVLGIERDKKRKNKSHYQYEIIVLIVNISLWGEENFLYLCHRRLLEILQRIVDNSALTSYSKSSYTRQVF